MFIYLSFITELVHGGGVKRDLNKDKLVLLGGDEVWPKLI